MNKQTMWALTKDKPEKGLWLKQVPIPETGRREVKIKIHKTAICGTDVHIYQWNRWAQKTIPMGLTVGHEYVGEIVETGQDVKKFAVGDIVSGEGHITCGKCRNCLEGHKENCCGVVGVGVSRNGAFAEYLVIPEENVWKCSREIPEEICALFDPLGNAAHTALSFDAVGEDILISGAGPIGCMAAAIARFCGARHVVVSDFNAFRLELAAKAGASRTADLNRESIRDIMDELGMTEGFDVGLEMSGSPQALDTMIKTMKHGGNIALLGLPDDSFSADFEKIIFNGLTLRGIYGRKVWDTWYKVSAMIQAGLDVSQIITHRFDAADFEQGFDAMLSGSSGKVILNWENIDWI